MIILYLEKNINKNGFFLLAKCLKDDKSYTPDDFEYNNQIISNFFNECENVILSDENFDRNLGVSNDISYDEKKNKNI